MSHTLPPSFATRSEIKRFVYQTHMRYPDCRPGQAICNYYSVNPVLERKIYELKTRAEVVQVIYNWYFTDVEV